MTFFTVHPFHSFNLAVVLLIAGKILTLNIDLLRRYSIPEPVAGGFLCIAVTGLLWALFDLKVSFEVGIRDFLLLVFFAGIGLKSDIRTLLAGGRPLVILLILATSFILLQNFAGMGLARLFGMEPKAGLMVGSVSLTGGVGTTLAWAPIFAEKLGITNALELGVAANTVGLIAACVIGGPIAALLIRRGGLKAENKRDLDIGVPNEGRAVRMDYFCILWSILALNVTVLIGLALHEAITAAGVTLPAFVSCLVAGIVLRNLLPLAPRRLVRRIWPGVDDALALISDLSLGLFLIMALMGLQVWELNGVLLFITAALVMQILLTVGFTIWVVFPAMGRDYEAAVISAGFGAITLGSTATAIANMTAVAQQHGAAHRAFVIVPLVCGFFIDIVNALIISALVG
ncbi:sodium/glutamate symporter [Paracoccus aerodenitrificans]|uniref:sodium/glutamate symporter n=1 Tax=Paracoccus aerodenitrificans TaxID=3017781 RepID=UPI0022F0BD2C|nr:sodium/glutamate symporter [Paracoccus aerodenitrificans]WBU62438.1 sodium/glutamate symporter [Paracoccus aerodenitrificans]